MAYAQNYKKVFENIAMDKLTEAVKNFIFN